MQLLSFFCTWGNWVLNWGTAWEVGKTDMDLFYAKLWFWTTLLQAPYIFLYNQASVRTYQHRTKFQSMGFVFEGLRTRWNFPPLGYIIYISVACLIATTRKQLWAVIIANTWLLAISSLYYIWNQIIHLFPKYDLASLHTF